MSLPCAPKPNACQPEKKTKINLSAWLSRARNRLSSSVDTPAEASLEASLLAAFVLRRPRSWVLAHPETSLDSSHVDELDRLLERLAAGVPLAYLTGTREFFGLDFIITPDVLVPRPETEHLVERALAWLSAHPDRRAAVDVGAGSGCIAVSLAHAVPGLHVTAVDRSHAALAVALRNAARHQVSNRLDFVQADLLTPFTRTFDLVCANLPYIPSADVGSLPVGRSEPRLALDGGPSGLDLITRLLNQLPSCLAPGGLALFEIEHRQGQQAIELARGRIPNATIAVYPDYASLDRLLAVQLENK